MTRLNPRNRKPQEDDKSKDYNNNTASSQSEGGGVVIGFLECFIGSQSEGGGVWMVDQDAFEVVVVDVKKNQEYYLQNGNSSIQLVIANLKNMKEMLITEAQDNETFEDFFITTHKPKQGALYKPRHGQSRESGYVECGRRAGGKAPGKTLRRWADNFCASVLDSFCSINLSKLCAIKRSLPTCVCLQINRFLRTMGKKRKHESKETSEEVVDLETVIKKTKKEKKKKTQDVTDNDADLSERCEENSVNRKTKKEKKKKDISSDVKEDNESDKTEEKMQVKEMRDTQSKGKKKRKEEQGSDSIEDTPIQTTDELSHSSRKKHKKVKGDTNEAETKDIDKEDKSLTDSIRNMKENKFDAKKENKKKGNKILLEEQDNKTETPKNISKVNRKESAESENKPVKSQSTTQNMLLEKLKSVQSKRSEKVLQKESITAKKRPSQNSGAAIQPANSDVKKESGVKQINNESVEDADEEDPEKAEIRMKKREKRRLKKVQKEKHKKEQAEKAGTAKVAAVEYLDLWENKREEWKFSKVRQCWLLQNMYKASLKLQGRARDVTVADAEKLLQEGESDDEDEDEDNDDDDEKEEEDEEGEEGDGKKTDVKEEKKKVKEVDPVQEDRAKQIIQLLSA
ncbi:CG050-like protein [Mya arenaria]|uniref:CG050-like protein n=1 Tax=Mya arenaria TaxID=6604 RepID=A0ABY7DCB7_MYAAR|nr:CG050-like protein [Mya arenaria]